MKKLINNHLLFKSLLALSILFWGCSSNTLVGPEDKMTLEYDGPVTVSYFEISKNPNADLQNPPTVATQVNINGEETFILKNMKNETAAYLQRRFPGNSLEGILEIMPGLNTAWLSEVNPQQDQATIDSISLNHASNSDYELQIGNNSPVAIISNIAISVSGANIKKASYFNSTQNSSVDLTSDQINQIVGDPTKDQILANSWGGPFTLLIKASGTEVAKTEGGSAPNTGTTPSSSSNVGQGGPSGQLTGGGCLQLAAESNASSTAWLWLAALGITAWIPVRRVKIRSR